MFNFFKKKNKLKESEALQSQSEDYTFTWYELGDKNPFNKKILDCRSLTQTLLSFTTDKSVAESFNKQRLSIGEECVNFEFKSKKSFDVNVVYPHNGSKIEGAAYKAKAMEDKWDIYGWNNIIYFVRSWTGEIVYKAFIKMTEKDFSIYKIEYSSDLETEFDISLIKNNVHFLLMTLAYGRIYPHKVPSSLKTDKEIAFYSFAQFGHNCWYATYEDILDTEIKTSSG